jgi:hypothetical protein
MAEETLLEELLSVWQREVGRGRDVTATTKKGVGSLLS